MKSFIIKQRVIAKARVVVLEVRIPAVDEAEAWDLYRGLIGSGARRESFSISEETLVDADQSGATTD